MSSAFRPALAAAALAAVLAGSATADPAFDKSLRDSLAAVHNAGADLYNTGKDYAGAYRMYEGALRTARPLLADRKDTQKAIDDGLDAAAKTADPARKAFLLHETIEKVRDHLKTPAGEAPKKAEEPKKTAPPPDANPSTATQPAKKVEEVPPPKATNPSTTTPPAGKKVEPEKADPPAPKKAEDPPPAPKKAEDPPAGKAATARAAAAAVKGTVTFKGEPVDAAEVRFVSLDGPAPRVATGKTAAGGAYSLGVSPGRYAVTVAGTGLPARYATTDTSGLTVEVAAGGGGTTFDIRLTE